MIVYHWADRDLSIFEPGLFSNDVHSQIWQAAPFHMPKEATGSISILNSIESVICMHLFSQNQTFALDWPKFN